MAFPYPFFAFCSDVLNDPMVRAEFTAPDTRDALFETYGLSKAQITAAKDRSVTKIMDELKKELDKIGKTSGGRKAGLILW